MQTLDKYFRELTAKVFSRYGSAAAEIIIRWPHIVGQDLASLCEPAKVTWPRGETDAARKSGGTLYLRTALGRALEVQHQAQHYAERINAYFGYNVISKLKLIDHRMVQKAGEKARAAPNPAISSTVSERIGAVADEPLRHALQRLGEGVWKNAPGTPWNSPETSLRETP